MGAISYTFAPITKVEENEDGTLLVHGPVSDGGLDRDRQRMDQAWLDAAMPRWMAEAGNVRLMHKSTEAVGVGVGLSRRDDGTHDLTALVVDDAAVKKVKTGVLKGFSIGIKEPRLDLGKADAPNGVIVGGDIIEVSLVDRPANPRTTFMVAKADGSGELAAIEDPELVEDEDEDDETDGEEEAEETNADEPTEARTKAEALADMLLKADAAADIDDAKTAIAAIGRLIASEAAGLSDGQLDESGDIKCLLDAVQALKFFIAREQSEPDAGDEAAPDDVTTTAIQGDDNLDVAGSAYEMKTDDTTTTPETPDLTKADGAYLTKAEQPEIVKAAVAEAIAAQEGRFAAIEAQLAKAMEMPVAGGPVATRTALQAQAARANDANTLLAQADDYLRKAEQTEDRSLKAGYLEKRAQLLRQANA